MKENTGLEKGGKPPAGPSGTGVGFAHQESQEGVPSENTANKQTSPTLGHAAGKGDLPGSMNKQAVVAEMVKGMSIADKAALIKSLFAEESGSSIQKGDEVPITRSELVKMFNDLRAQITAPVVAPKLQLDKGLVEIGQIPARPELEKSDTVPVGERSGSELQKAFEWNGERVDVAAENGSYASGYVPTANELARMSVNWG